MSRASVGVFTPHMDVPVVAVRTSIMTSLVKEDEVSLFEDGDYQQFADDLIRLHEDPEFGRQVATRARRFTRDYSWERDFAGYLQLLGRLTGRELTAKAPALAAVGLAAGIVGRHSPRNWGFVAVGL